ncbi:SOS response-associated peptidase [Roseococcus sp. SYP-B2431]|uniref:SOS response-associated peptidase n=1 Tax=Roseococcus sp. SYP-B2431 TaxID=2496640 RepID=UPI00103F371B|nr:SOS response-associated peptidase [Roseococcus sp. SYP-B2431]TCI00481.1 SOS response-associated peptidase [Roseococcus sp. SYP-B2431]
MCGRYILQRDPAGLATYFETPSPAPNFAASWNLAPTQEGLVVRRHPQTGARHIDILRWGLVPRWAKDAAGAARLINARSETILEKPSFREAFSRRRCLVPMDGFYEWHAEAKARQPFAVALRDGAPMAVAGLWEGWRRPDGTWLRSYSVITTASAGRQALMHARMPVILPREAWASWLAEAPAREEELRGLMRPAADSLLAFWPVGARVGRVSENDAALLAPAAPELPAGLGALRDPPPEWAAP